MALTIEEIDAYNTQGFVLIKDVLSPSDTKPVIDELGAFMIIKLMNYMIKIKLLTYIRMHLLICGMVYCSNNVRKLATAWTLCICVLLLCLRF